MYLSVLAPYRSVCVLIPVVVLLLVVLYALTRLAIVAVLDWMQERRATEAEFARRVQARKERGYDPDA